MGQEVHGMKKAIGLEDKGNREIGTARVARGKWREILGWQKLEEQMGPQSKHTHPSERERSQLPNATTGPAMAGLGKPQIG